MFDVSGPVMPTRVTAPSAASAGPALAGTPNGIVVDSVESAEPEPKRTRRGIVPRSASRVPAPDAGEIRATPETEPARVSSQPKARAVPEAADEVPAGAAAKPRRRRGSLRKRSTTPRREVTESVLPLEATSVAADTQLADSTPAARSITEYRMEGLSTAVARESEAPPPPPPPMPPSPMPPRPPPPPPPIEVPAPLPHLAVGRTPVDLAASAAMAQDILAASEEQPPQPPSRRGTHPTTPADGMAGSPSVPGGDQSRDPTDEVLESSAADDAPVASDFFAPARAKKRFRRE